MEDNPNKSETIRITYISFNINRNIHMDTLSENNDTKNMAAVHSTNTKPEIIVRKYLFSRGFQIPFESP